MSDSRLLRVFLCHASQDKPAVRALYGRLSSENWIDPWLDEVKILPGMNWDLEINKALRNADVVLICLSQQSISKEGYVQREFRRALDYAEEKPEGTLYIIPLRLDNCNPPLRLQQLQWLDYFAADSHDKLLRSLRLRANHLGLYAQAKSGGLAAEEDYDLYSFIQIPPSAYVDHPFWIGKYPVTNSQYVRFLKAADFANPLYWLEFPEFDEYGKRIGNWGRDGLNWLHDQLGRYQSKVLLPRYHDAPLHDRPWDNVDFRNSIPDHPVVGISWFEAYAYCEWLFQHWDTLIESKVNPSLEPQEVRLPIDDEWVTAAGGMEPKYRFPWDEPGEETYSLKEIVRRANVKESDIGHTTPVNAYPLGKSPFGVMDMAGNVSEWLANNSGYEWKDRGDSKSLRLSVRISGYGDEPDWLTRVNAINLVHHPYMYGDRRGFRVVVISGTKR